MGLNKGRQCGRDHTIIICGEEIPACRRYETEYAERERERERERGTKNISIHKQATVTTMNNQPLQKVTKSHYIVTHLGQLPFMLFT